MTKEICPACGLPTAYDGAPTVEVCTPISCPAWSTVAVADPETRNWIPVDDDGYALDGHKIGEPQ